MSGSAASHEAIERLMIGSAASVDAVTVLRALPEKHRADAAFIFDEAFADKLALAIPSRDRRLAFLAQVFSADHMLAALDRDELVGVAGLSSADGPFRGGLMTGLGDVRGWRGLLGTVGAIRAAVSLSMTDHRPAPGELYVDGIAVASWARGRGIGTRLIGEIVQLAQEHGFHWVRLEVIDANVRARRLYERRGFTVTRVQRFGLLRPIVGFGGVISMELDVDASPRVGHADGIRRAY